MVAAMLKETEQETLIKKLCHPSRKNKAKEALWEYNDILMSIYLLNYIDDPILRRLVRKSLNRGEGYHQLRRCLAEVNGGEFRGDV